MDESERNNGPSKRGRGRPRKVDVDHDVDREVGGREGDRDEMEGRVASSFSLSLGHKTLRMPTLTPPDLLMIPPGAMPGAIMMRFDQVEEEDNDNKENQGRADSSTIDIGCSSTQ